MTAPAPKLGDLLKRLEAGPGRELDARLLLAFNPPHPNAEFVKLEGFPLSNRVVYAWGGSGRGGCNGILLANVPAYTASLDAVLALVEEKLPGRLWQISTVTTAIGGKRQPQALVVAPDHAPGQEIASVGSASTPSLALLKALVSALSSENSGSDEGKTI